MEVFICYKDGSGQLNQLKLLKEYNPLEVAEFATAQGISEEPSFIWWLPYTLRRRDRIISTVNKCIQRMSHKYGVEIPTSVEYSYKIDTDNGNHLWRTAINRKMENLRVAFNILHKGQIPPQGYIIASGHLTIDIRMTLECNVCAIRCSKVSVKG